MRKKTKALSALPEVDADENGGVGIAEGEARVDTMENRGKMNGVVFARNAVWEIARKVREGGGGSLNGGRGDSKG